MLAGASWFPMSGGASRRSAERRSRLLHLELRRAIRTERTSCTRNRPASTPGTSGTL